MLLAPFDPALHAGTATIAIDSAVRPTAAKGIKVWLIRISIRFGKPEPISVCEDRVPRPRSGSELIGANQCEAFSDGLAFFHTDFLDRRREP